MHVDDFIINALGLVGTGFSICMWAPQARITWQSRNDPARLAGVSETTQWLLLIGYLIWGVYGVLSGSIWITMPSIVASPLALATIIVVRRGRRLPMTVSVPIISANESHSDVDTTTGVIPVIPVADTVHEIDMTSPIPIVSTEVDVEVQDEAEPATGTIPIFASDPVDAVDVAQRHTLTITDPIVQQAPRVSAGS